MHVGLVVFSSSESMSRPWPSVATTCFLTGAETAGVALTLRHCRLMLAF